MRERIPCEFFLIRYVPDTVRNEFVNIGVLLRTAVGVAPTGDGAARTAVDGAVPAGGDLAEPMIRFTRDWSRVRCMDPDADVELLEALEGELQQRLRMGAADTQPVMKMLEESFSNTVQITEAKACLAESVAAEMEQLARMYVEPMRVKQARRKTGRAAIAGAMRNEFERAGVWGLMRKRIAAAMYTRPGDPLRIDCGYRPNGVIRMFHAVSLAGDVEAAKVLAYSSPMLAEGVRRVENASLELTAVVEPLAEVRDGDDEERMAEYRFGVETMEQQSIRVMTVNDLGRMAETARRELIV